MEYPYTFPALIGFFFKQLVLTHRYILSEDNLFYVNNKLLNGQTPVKGRFDFEPKNGTLRPSRPRLVNSSVPACNRVSGLFISV